MELFEWTLGLLLAAVALTALSRKVGAPYPALLALAGAAIAVLPIDTGIRIDPELALALFIAPVLLDAAYDTSPRDLKRNIVPLAALVVVAVLLTTAVVAWVGWRFAGLPIAAAIALGAIVAPPDAAAASAVLDQVKAPERLMHILRGESLLNDAVALLIYRMAVVAAAAPVTLGGAAPLMAWALLGSPVAGVLLARLYARLTARIEDAPSATVLQFVGAFGVWILAEHAQLSAIITVVAYAMTIARSAPRKSPARVRVSSYSVWETAVFVLNVLAFVLMGLQARPVIERLPEGERWAALGFSAVVLAVCIGVRLVFVMGYSGVLLFKNRHYGANQPSGHPEPNARGGLLVGWCGMRGLVTLAAAFALPERFPQRDLIVLCAFVVVLGTLIIQGFTLPWLLRVLRLEPGDMVEQDVSRGRTCALDAALENIRDETSPVARALRGELQAARRVAADPRDPQAATEHDALRLRTLHVQRETLHRMRRDATIGDEAYHRLMEELDWNELSAAPPGDFQALTTA